jgi:hypothetical protein
MKNLFLAVATILLTSFSYQLSNAHVAVDSKAIPNIESFGGAYLVFAGKFGGELTKKDIANTKALGVEGCAKGSVIYQFDLKITKNGKTTTYHGKSDQLTEVMHAQLKQLSKGDEFTFKNTKAHLPKKAGAVDVWAKKFIIV